MNESRIPPRRTIQPITILQQLLGPCVLLKCTGKKPVQRGWQQLTLDDMTAEYIDKLKGNIGVSLGDASAGLCAIDIDHDSLVKPFLDCNPPIAKTFTTRGSRGAVFWVRLTGHCPRTIKLKTASGEEAGEFRGTGGQSIIYGIHPSTNKPYQWLVERPVITIDFASIQWPQTIVNPLPPENPPYNNPPIESRPVATSRDGTSRLSMVGVCAAGASEVSLPISTESKTQIEQAVLIGEQATRRNNSASFEACLALLTIRKVETLANMPAAEKLYFADCWYRHLHSKGRIKAGKQRSHYTLDIMNSIKNAKATNKTKNPLPQAWMLANTEPMPPEAAMFGEDRIMRQLVALCYQLHCLNDGGTWFLARDKAGQLLGLDATATRSLSDNFAILVNVGILKVETPADKQNRKAATYRFVPQVS